MAAAAEPAPRTRAGLTVTACRTVSGIILPFPGGVVRAIAHAARSFYETLARDGTTDAFRDRMFDFDSLNAVIGTPEMLALGRRYEEDSK